MKQSNKNNRNKKSNRRINGQRRNRGALVLYNTNPMLKNNLRSYKGEVLQILKLVSGTITISTDSSGLVAFVKGLDAPTDISQWNTHVADIYSEYRVRKAVIKVIMADPTSTGSSRCYFDVVDSTPPTFLPTERQGVIEFSNNCNSSIAPPPMVFTTRQLTGNEFAPVTSSNNLTYWKMFTNAGNLLASPSKKHCTLRIYYTIEVRGMST
jgi:hypothetical protein